MPLIFSDITYILWLLDLQLTVDADTVNVERRLVFANNMRLSEETLNANIGMAACSNQTVYVEVSMYICTL